MTNKRDYAPITYSCNGATVDFPFSWKILYEESVVVSLIDSNNQTTNLNLGTDYTVEFDEVGGNVKTKIAYETGNTIVVGRNASMYQEKSFSTSGGFQASEIENAFDTTSINLQDMDYNIKNFKETFSAEIGTKIETYRNDVTTQIETNKQEILNIQSDFKDEVNTKIQQVSDAAAKINQLEDAVNTAVTSANTATEKANMAGAEVEKAKAEVTKATETVQNSLTNIESKTLEGINKIKQTGFYMEGDKLYYIDSNGETKEFKSTGTSSKIGDIGFAPYVDETTNERRRLNGQVLIKDQYPAFVTWLTSLQATTPSLFTTEDEWQAIKTASKLGQCGKFVIGDTTIRLPQVININGLVDMSNAGLIKDESLPDPNPELYSIWGGGSGTGGNQSLIAQNYSGSIQPTHSSGSTYIKVDNSTYQDNAPVQQEAIQYPFYITVNTGSETTKPTINDYTVTTAYQYGISQYYKGIMNSGAWLRSNGQMNPKTTYEGLYNWALAQLNAGVEGFKSSTAIDITDYDFVINQTDETFRLPLKNGMEGVFASRAKGDGTTIGLTDGSDTSGLAGYSNGILSGQSPNYGDPVGTTYKTGTVNINKTVGLTTDPTKSGIVVDLTVPSGYNLYYYCGNVEENPQAVNVARIEEALVDKVDVVNTQWATNACTPDYTAGIALTSATLQGFVAPSDGVITGAINWDSSTKYLKVNGHDVLAGNTETSSVYISLAKGDKLSYDASVVEAGITRLYFYPLKGANNV